MKIIKTHTELLKYLASISEYFTIDLEYIYESSRWDSDIINWTYKEFENYHTPIYNSAG